LPNVAQKESRRIAGVQVCRGLAALLVVLAHLHGIEIKYCDTNYLLLFEHGALGVDLFFVISGIVIASVTTNKFGNPRNAGTFFYHRVARIFPVFWIYTTFTLIARRFNPLGIDMNRGQPINLLASYMLIPTHRPMLLLQGWTLSYELYFYFVFFLLLLLVSQRTAVWLLALWGVTVIVFKLHIGLSPYPLLQLLISPSVLEFLCGCIIFHIYCRYKLHRVAGILLLFASLLWLSVILAYSLHVHSGQAAWITDSPWPRALLYGPFAFLFLLGAIELERTDLVRYFPLLKSFGDWSYSIYLSHVLILELIARLAYHLFPNHHNLILIIAIIGLPSTVCAGYLSYIYLEQPLITHLYKSDPNRFQNGKTIRLGAVR
jgi:exopolysaccharide production protein ExoZ